MALLLSLAKLVILKTAIDEEVQFKFELVTKPFEICPIRVKSQMMTRTILW